MYLGGILLLIGAPMLLGSLWGVGIGAAMVLLLAGRIVGEEKMLTEDSKDTRITRRECATG
jgi:protein-S-isoprenylcysteine O-methyltransferase Ste14